MKKVKTTIRRRPNKNQQGKQAKNKTQSTRRKIIQIWRTEEPNSQKWKHVGLEKGMSGNVFEGKMQRWRKERGNKDRAQKTKRECYLKNGLMNEKSKDGILKGKTEGKAIERRARGEEQSKICLLNCRTQLLCITDSKPCHKKKTPELQEERRYLS